MPNWKKLTQQAKKVVDQRGGTDALKKDLNELKDIAKSKGSLGDKAKAAGDALKQPGAGEPDAPPAPPTNEPAPPPVAKAPTSPPPAAGTPTSPPAPPPESAQ